MNLVKEASNNAHKLLKHRVIYLHYYSSC